MRRVLLPLLLATAITLAPARARADGILAGKGDVLLLLALGVVGTIGTVETLTVVSSVKNYRSWRDERDPSVPWVTVGGVGGLLNAGIGGALVVNALLTEEGLSHGSHARVGQLVVGSLLTGLGAFSLTMAIQAAVTSAPKATSTNAAPLLAPVGFMLPPIRF